MVFYSAVQVGLIHLCSSLPPVPVSFLTWTPHYGTLKVSEDPHPCSDVEL